MEVIIPKFNIGDTPYGNFLSEKGLKLATENIKRSENIEASDLIKGQFYVGEWYINSWCLFKYSGNLGYRNEHITSTGIYDINSCCTAKGITFRTAAPEEKEWLEHCIKINKYVSIQEFRNLKKNEEWIPKAGDWVTMLSDYNELKAGQTYKVLRQQSVHDLRWFVLDHAGERSYSAPNKDQFRKAEGHEIHIAMQHQTLEVPKKYEHDIPEYFECIKQIGYCKVGSIFKIRYNREWLYEPFNCTDQRFSGRWDGVSGKVSEWFKPSTKEAYDTQNGPKFIVGEYYSQDFEDKSSRIFTYKNEAEQFYYINPNAKAFFTNNRDKTCLTNARKATPEEKQWLDACIKAGEYLTKEEALSKTKFKVGDWVRPNFSVTHNNGKAEKVTEVYSDYFKVQNRSCQCIYDNYRLAEIHEIPAETSDTQTKKSKLLEVAKRKYPIGTIFEPAHLRGLIQGERCIVTNDNFIYSDSDTIWVLTDEGGEFSKLSRYGNTSSQRVVYYKGIWADIIEENKDKTTLVYGSPGAYGGTINISSKEAFHKAVEDTINPCAEIKLTKPFKPDLEFQEPVLVTKKKTKFKLVTINQ